MNMAKEIIKSEKQINKTEKLSEDTLNNIILNGDISGLEPPQLLEYYKWYCERFGLDSASKPFQIIEFKEGKKVLYCTREGCQQLSKINEVSHQITDRQIQDTPEGKIFLVTARAILPSNRFSESIGAVSLYKADGVWMNQQSPKKNYFKPNGKYLSLKGDEYCNAIMKTETKAKRRATLDLLGLGIMEEQEVETIPNAKIENINPQIEITGTIIKEPKKAKSVNIETGEVNQNLFTNDEELLNNNLAEIGTLKDVNELNIYYLKLKSQKIEGEIKPIIEKSLKGKIKLLNCKFDVKTNRFLFVPPDNRAIAQAEKNHDFN